MHCTNNKTRMSKLVNCRNPFGLFIEREFTDVTEAAGGTIYMKFVGFSYLASIVHLFLDTTGEVEHDM